MKEEKTEFERRCAALDEQLGVGRSFDMVGRSLVIGGRRAKLWVVNGYAQDSMLERIIAAWMPLASLDGVADLQTFVERFVTACDATVETARDKAVTAVFAQTLNYVFDGSGADFMTLRYGNGNPFAFLLAETPALYYITLTAIAMAGMALIIGVTIGLNALADRRKAKVTL